MVGFVLGSKSCHVLGRSSNQNLQSKMCDCKQRTFCDTLGLGYFWRKVDHQFLDGSSLLVLELGPHACELSLVPPLSFCYQFVVKFVKGNLFEVEEKNFQYEQLKIV